MNKDLAELETKDLVMKTEEYAESPVDILLEDLNHIENGIIPEDFVKDYKKFQKMKIKMEEMEKQVKAKMKEIFEANPDTIGKHIRSGGIKFTYKVGYDRKSIDSKKLQEEYPEIYKKVIKSTHVNPTVLFDIEY